MSIYTIKISKHYKSGFYLFVFLASWLLNICQDITGQNPTSYAHLLWIKDGEKFRHRERELNEKLYSGVKIASREMKRERGTSFCDLGQYGRETWLVLSKCLFFLKLGLLKKNSSRDWDRNEGRAGTILQRSVNLTWKFCHTTAGDELRIELQFANPRPKAMSASLS